MREAPQKMKGNAPFEEVNFKMISSISKSGITRSYDLVQADFIKIKDHQMDLYVSKDHPFYVLGRFFNDTEKEERFATVFELTFRKTTLKSKQKQLNNKDVILIDTVQTAKDYRENKIAQTMYEFLLSKFIIISDQVQYEGAINLWKRLIVNNVVYTYDILEDKIISKVSPNTPESQIWSDDSSKRRIKLVMIP